MKSFKHLIFGFGLLALITVMVASTTSYDSWQPPITDDSITGNGTHEDPLGVTVATVYAGRITQASTSAPTALEYYNGIDPSVFTYTRDSIGTYKIEGSDAAFPDSTYLYLFTLGNSAVTALGGRVYWQTDSTLILKVFKSNGYGVDLAGTGSLVILDANPLGE